VGDLYMVDGGEHGADQEHALDDQHRAGVAYPGRGQ